MSKPVICRHAVIGVSAHNFEHRCRLGDCSTQSRRGVLSCAFWLMLCGLAHHASARSGVSTERGTLFPSIPESTAHYRKEGSAFLSVSVFAPAFLACKLFAAFAAPVATALYTCTRCRGMAGAGAVFLSFPFVELAPRDQSHSSVKRLCSVHTGAFRPAEIARPAV